MIPSRAFRLLLSSLGVSSLIWAFLDPRFRGPQGHLLADICLPIAAGVAFLILGYTFGSRLSRAGFWFAVALFGQAVALQMIDAGPSAGYQHYRPWSRLLRDTHPLLLVYLVGQAVLVAAAMRTRWPTVKSWLGRHFALWHLIALALIFSLSSAAASQDVARYLLELLLATFVQAINLTNIVLLVWALPEDVLASCRQRLAAFLGPTTEKATAVSARGDRFAVLAAVWVVTLAALLSAFSYQRHPHVPDEVIYLYQARYFAQGSVTVPAYPAPEAFSFYMIPHESPSWYSIFPPGWAAVLAIGVLCGAPWLVNPVLGGLNMLLIYSLFLQIANRSFARTALCLICTSPWFVFMTMSFMSHTLTLTCALAGVISMARALRTGKTLWGLLAGGAAGMVSLIRPLDGLIVAAALGLWVSGIGGRRSKVGPFLAFITGTLLVAAIVLPYNRQVTGDATTFPLTAYYEEYFGPKANAYGFGPERGFGWAIDPFPGHGPVDALVNASLNTFAINVELFGWSTGSLVLVAFLLFSRRLQRHDYLTLGLIAGIVVVYSLYWFSGGPDFGARYWYLMIVPLLGLSVRGIRALQERLEAGGNEASGHATRVIIAVLALSTLSLLNFFPWRALDKYYQYRNVRPGIRHLATELGWGRSLVLIRGDYGDYQSAWIQNPLHPDADEPVYAWDRTAEIRAEVLEAYPDRPVWVVNGPSLTDNGFEVVAGPVTGRDLIPSDACAE